MLSHEKLLIDLIHDLSQPLGNIETSAYCLNRCIDPHDEHAQKYLRMIQQQVEHATGMLSAAAAELARTRTQRVEPAAAYALAAAASH